MRALALVLVASVALADDQRGRFDRFCSRSSQGRTNRGFDCQDFAFFEAFPANGAGTFGVCSTTTPTGAKGEALTFARTGTATCTKTLAGGGLTNTGIANGDLVVMSSGVPRVEYDSQGALGLLVESSRVNLNAQSANLADAVYSSVGAPTVTANTTVSPDGTTTMATIQDNAAGAQEGRAQTITATAGQPYTLSVYVKAGTLSSVTISLDGTTATCTSLSATTSTRCIVTDVSASGVAISAQVLGGTVVADTGTFIAWGQQVELGTYATSYTPTVASAVTRNAEAASFTLSLIPGVTGSAAGSFTPQWTGASGGNFGGPQVYFGSSARPLQGFSNSVQAFDGVNNPVVTASYVQNTKKRAYSSWSSGNGWLIRNATDAVQTTSAFNAAGWSGSATATLCVSNCGAFFPDGLVGLLCYDPAESRCR